MTQSAVSAFAPGVEITLSGDGSTVRSTGSYLHNLFASQCFNKTWLLTEQPIQQLEYIVHYRL